VFETNRPALRLYASFDFREEGRLKGHVLVDGRFVDEVHMARELRSG
jgi:RimJ/RimL family protein N-acetyltransferase